MHDLCHPREKAGICGVSCPHRPLFPVSTPIASGSWAERLIVRSGSLFIPKGDTSMKWWLILILAMLLAGCASSHSSMGGSDDAELQAPLPKGNYPGGNTPGFHGGGGGGSGSPRARELY
jgi:hypothetical protein